MAAEIMKQGIAGASYDTSKVFDPSKLKTKADEAPKIAGLDVSPNAGVSTTAGANYYAGQSMPSGTPMAIAGGKPQQQQPAAVQVQPIGTIAGMPADSSTNQTSGPLGMPGKPPAIAGVNAFSFDNKQPAGGVVANGSGNDYSAGSPLAKAATTVDSLGRSYNEQVAHAKEVNTNTMQQLGNISDKQKFDMTFVGKADTSNPSYKNAILTRDQWEKNNTNGQQVLSRDKELSIAGMGLANDRYKTDQTLAGEKYKADMKLAGEHIKSDAELSKSVVAGREKAQLQYTDRVKGLVSGWEKLNVPTEVAPKLNYYAHLHAQAEDPKGNVFMLSPNRQGGMYAALPKQYEPHYQGLLKTMKPADASARIYALAQKNGHAIDVPDFNRFQTKRDAVNGG